MNTIHGHWNDSPDAVTLIDAHHHLWDLTQGKHPWLCGAEEKEFFMGAYGPLKRNHQPDEHPRDAAAHHVLTTSIARPNGTAPPRPARPAVSARSTQCTASPARS